MRLFVAVELDEPVTAALSAVQQSLKRGLGSGCIRWTDPRGTHLTLKFIGDTDERKVADLERALTEATVGHDPLALTLGGVGVFPNRRRPRVIWVGLEGAIDGLAKLQQSMEKAVCHLGMPPEDRSFSPHLTVGRVRDGALASDYDAIGAALDAVAPFPAATLAVEAVSLMRSVLRPEGAQYTRLFSAPLGR